MIRRLILCKCLNRHWGRWDTPKTDTKDVYCIRCGKMLGFVDYCGRRYQQFIGHSNIKEYE